MTTTERTRAGTLPAEPEAERALLGAVLINGALLARASEVLTPEDFSSEPHRTIFAACERVAATGASPDLVTVEAELSAREQLERAGGPGYLAGLLDVVPDLENAVAYARLVEDASRRRRMVLAARRLHAALARGAETETAAGLREALQAELRDLDEDEPTRRRAAAPPLFLNLPEAVALNVPRHPSPLGILPFDHCLGGGLGPNEGIVLGGAPGAFKTSTVAFAIPHLAGPDTAVLVVAADEPAHRVARKIATRYDELWNELSSEYPPVIARLERKLRERDAYVRITHPRADFWLEDALDAFDKEAPRNRRRVVIIDHLQSVYCREGSSDSDSEKVEIERVVNCLVDKYMRKKEWTVIALSEVTKAALVTAVTMSDPMVAFAGTRKIVSRFDASFVLVPEEAHRVRVLTGKNRLGPKSAFTLEWNIETWNLSHVDEADREEERLAAARNRAAEVRKERQVVSEQAAAAAALSARELIVAMVARAQNPETGVPYSAIRGAWLKAGLGHLRLAKPALELACHDGAVETYQRKVVGEAGAPKTYVRFPQQKELEAS